MFIRCLIAGMLFEEKKDESGGAGGGAEAAKPNAGAQGGQVGAADAVGARGGAEAGKGAQEAVAGQGAGVAKPKPAPKPKPPEPTDDGEEDDEDGIPKADEQGMLAPMSRKAFLRRAGRMTKKELRETFGTDDKEAIKKAWDELPELRKYKDQAEREKMSEREKMAADKAAAEKRAQDAELRAEAAEQNADAREYNSQLRVHLSTIVDKTDIPDMLDKLSRVVVSGDVKTMKEAKEWLSEYVEKNPKWKKTVEVEATEGKAEADKAKKEVRKVPVSTTKTREQKPKPASGGEDNFDYRTASKAEIFAKTGYRL